MDMWQLHKQYESKHCIWVYRKLSRVVDQEGDTMDAKSLFRGKHRVSRMNCGKFDAVYS